jgi:hypothetical protein
MSKKLILPAEIKICATCSFWDGNRSVDPELAIVVVDENCQGECLVKNRLRRGLNDELNWNDDCLWEHIAPDMPGDGERPLSRAQPIFFDGSFLAARNRVSRQEHPKAQEFVPDVARADALDQSVDARSEA